MSESEILSRQEWRIAVQNRIGTDDFKIDGVKVGPTEEGVAGFMSDQLKAVVSVSRGDDESSRQEELKFFLKAVPVSMKYRRDFISASGAYKKEIDFYEKINAELRFSNVVHDPLRLCVPVCYFTREDAIVLEDLNDKGFTMVRSRIELDYDHCQVVLRCLANFHAATFIYEERMSSALSKPYRVVVDLGEMLSDILLETIDMNGTGRSWIRSCFTSSLTIIPLLPKYKGQHEICQKIQQNWMSVFDHQVPEMFTASKEFRNVVCHGDLWSNNLLFKYDQDGKPEEVRFVDYQIVRYLPPATDVMIFLHTTTRRSFREEHAEKLLDEYYEEIARTLEHNGVDRHIYPKSLFSESCKRLRKVGALIAMVYSLQIYMPSDFVADILSSESEIERFTFIDRGPEALQCFLTDSVYRERVTEALEEFIEVFSSTLIR